MTAPDALWSALLWSLPFPAVGLIFCVIAKIPGKRKAQEGRK